MIRSKNGYPPCVGCGGHATGSCGHGNRVCGDCTGQDVCGACVMDASEAAAEAA